jgi:predicted transcriptional regulator
VSNVKRGRLSKNEQEFIRLHGDKMSAAEIGAALGRSAHQVETELLRTAADRPAAGPPEEPKAVKAILRDSSLWKRLSLEFEDGELEYFEEQYLKLKEQFREDVMPTEENQLVKLLKLDVYLSRNSVKQKKCNREIERLEKAQQELVKAKPVIDLFTDESTAAALTMLQNELNSAHAQHKSLTTEMVQLEEKHQKLMDQLKATRSQRIDKIETGKVDFLGVIRQITERETQEEAGRYIEMMKRASNAEYKRLATPHKYMDGVVDQPLLTPDSLELLDSGGVEYKPERPKRPVKPDKTEGTAS